MTAPDRPVVGTARHQVRRFWVVTAVDPAGTVHTVSGIYALPTAGASVRRSVYRRMRDQGVVGARITAMEVLEAGEYR